MSFQEKYIEITSFVKDDINKVKYELLSDIMVQEPLNSKLLDVLNAPSKHIRAVTAFLFLKAAGYPIDEKQIILQVAVELVHNASLIHDDVIDESILRRNQKTLNNQFENKLAVISGDYILSIALKKICLLNCSELTKMFAQTLDKMCQGEISQHFDRFKIPTLDNYLKKSRQKTASLFETAICGAMLLSGADIDASEFALNFGTAFQLRDDLINAKTTKSDIKDGIYTAPVIFSGDPLNVEKGIEKTAGLLNNYVNKTVKYLENIENNIYKQKLRELTELLADG